MRQTFKLGVVKGVPVGMNWSVLVTLVLVTQVLAQSILPSSDPTATAAARWSLALPTAILFFASLAAHEIAHALVARHYGVSVKSITLWMLGGVAELDGDPPHATADLRIAGVGPLASLGAAVGFGGAWAAADAFGAPALGTSALAWLAVTNAFVAVFNLLPGAPLDGGRILRALLWRRRGDRIGAGHAADRAGLALGRALIGGGLAALLVAGWFDGLWLALIGWFIAGSAKAEDHWATVREAAQDLRVADIMTPAPDHGWTWQPVAAFVETVALPSRQSVFVVTDIAGYPSGTVTLRRLADVPPEKGDIHVGDLATPLRPERVVRPEDPVLDLLKTAPMAGGLVAAVVSDHRLVGMVTTADVERSLQHGRLRRSTPTTG